MNPKDSSSRREGQAAHADLHQIRHARVIVIVIVVEERMEDTYSQKINSTERNSEADARGSSRQNQSDARG